VHASRARFSPRADDARHTSDRPRHETCAIEGMHNPQSSTVLQHAIEIAELARPVVAQVQRRDNDLASQLRRAISSVALNVAEAQGNSGGNSRVRYESALGSLYETQAGVRLAVAWGYVSPGVVAEVLGSMHRLGGRVFGLVRR
jgi:four helix bundle protein